MKLSAMRPGMVLNCIGNFANCIHAGRTYTVAREKFSWRDCFKAYFRGEWYRPSLYIVCDSGHHELVSSTTEDGDLPEFEVAPGSTWTDGSVAPSANESMVAMLDSIQQQLPDWWVAIWNDEEGEWAASLDHRSPRYMIIEECAPSGAEALRRVLVRALDPKDSDLLPAGLEEALEKTIT
jgi:hypothetical protein